MALAAQPFWITRGMIDTWEIKHLVASGTTASIDRGTPAKLVTSKAAIMVDGNGTTSELFLGLAKDASTETSSAAGYVNLWFPAPAVEYRGQAKTATLANTQALIDALVAKRVVFDLTASAWTVDTAASDATTNCLRISGGNYFNSEISFTYNVNGSLANPTT